MAGSPFSIENKVAIVTGGGVGIGRSIALEFARAGADVVVASRKLENLEPVAAEIQKLGRRGAAVAMDVRQEDAMKALVERTVKDFGRLDVMINNAGASFRARPEDISPNGWNAVIGINLNGVFFGCKWAGRQMMAQGGGVIINIASVAGVSGAMMMSHYGAAKAAVINFTRTLGMAWGRQNIRVNCIAPGPIETEGYLDVLHQTNPDAKKIYDTVASRVGMGRWGRVEEIAYPCIFLASDASSFMTGTTIIVDGGPNPQLGEG
ncbi:MAG: 3-oxoacyl-ACP reductase [Candidatus Rokuibacteriota bacterium]|nr:MAG: 3-oxoacyl-ACP reductase [Candidatus Rokubacteria bacterium]